MLVAVTERSGDAKLSKDCNVSATWVPQASCHDDCPLKRNGCYAEIGRAGIHTWNLNKRAAKQRKSMAVLRQALAKQEAAEIRKLSGTRKLRVHVVGDCATADAARAIGRAMVAHQKKHGKAAWTYTHSWRRIAKRNWMGANALASCETPEQVEQAKAKGYAAALIVPPHPTNKVYQYKGINVVPCPAQFVNKDGTRTVHCEECNLCQNTQMLLDRNMVVGFQPDGITTKRILRVIGADHAERTKADTAR